MYPSRNPYGGSGRGFPGFQPTLVNRGGSTHSSRDSRSMHTGQSSAQGGQTTIVRPGQPHYFNTRTDYNSCRIFSTMCRCQNPNSHGNAWTLDMPIGHDKGNILISWQTLAHRVLDCVGTPTVSHEVARTTWQHILCPRDAWLREEHEQEIERHISQGKPIFLSPYPEDVTHYNGDGHAQQVIGQHGLQTRITGPLGRERRH